MLPTSLPELPKPSRTSGESRKHQFLNPIFYIKIRETVFGHNSLPRRKQITILRHKLPIITPDLPIPTRRQNSSVKPELLKPNLLYKSLKISFVVYTQTFILVNLIVVIRFVLYTDIRFKNSGLMLEFRFLVGIGRSGVTIGRFSLNMVS